jgi:siroheme synthase
MGLSHISEIACRLTENGLPADMPAAAIANGTLPEQQVVVGTLASLPDRVKAAALSAPVLFVVGRVVEIRDTLAAAAAPGAEAAAERIAYA